MAKTKALISFAVTAKLICVLVFAYAKSRFSHDEAHFIHCDPVHTILIIKAFCLQSIGALTNDGRIQVISGNLTIQALRKSDHGVYECEASNEVRKIVTTTELVIQSKYEPRHEKTNVMVSDLVRHKPGCTATEDGQRLEISDLESRGVVLSI